ncbi:MAG: nucleoside kinase [Clostridiales bacterium]|nr:nucleoside kinase [Clostridiales bacterium]
MQNFDVEIELEPGKYERKSVPEGTTFAALAKECQGNYADAIILAMADGNLRELNQKVKSPCKISFLTITSKDGKRTYRRSVTLLMQKAIENLWHGDIRVRVFYRLGQAYYCELEGCETTQERIDEIRAEMKRLVGCDIPIEKRSVNSTEAEAQFLERGMKDKARLLHYRRSSWVNIYEIDGMEDYFYGYMAPSTGMLGVFELELYDEGFVLCFPHHDGNKVEPFETSSKLHRTLRESRSWSQMLGVGTVGALNDAISAGRGEEIILLQEALIEERIGTLAAQIKEREDVKFVMIAGPSSSGKTTFANRLSIQLLAKGLTPHLISLDNYYRDREFCPRDENGELDFECLEALDVELYNKDMLTLLNGGQINLPTFNFKTGKREYHDHYFSLGEGDILVIEGIHGLNDKLSHSLPKESKFKVYISALTQLNIDEHNPLSTTDCRLLRRIIRDARTRGTTAQETIAMWDSVRRGEEKNIFPFQESADVIFNSAMLYEIAVLKVYTEPLLFQIPRDCPEHLEAKRLLKFLDYFLPLAADGIQQTSLMREFIGGSCFNV